MEITDTEQMAFPHVESQQAVEADNKRYTCPKVLAHVLDRSSRVVT